MHNLKTSYVWRNYHGKMNENYNFCEGEEKRSDDPLFSCKNDARPAGKTYDR